MLPKYKGSNTLFIAQEASSKGCEVPPKQIDRHIHKIYYTISNIKYLKSRHRFLFSLTSMIKASMRHFTGCFAENAGA